MCSKRRRRDPQNHPAFWESMVTKYEGRNCELEERENELQTRLDMLERTAPGRVLFNMWKLIQDPVDSQERQSQSQPHLHSRLNRRNRYNRSRSRSRSKSRSRSRSKEDIRDRSRSPIQHANQLQMNRDSEKMILQQYIRTLEEEKGQLTRQKLQMECLIKDLEIQLQESKQNNAKCCNSDEDTLSIESTEFELIKSVEELKQRGQEMSKRIEIMEKREAAYLETLKQADEICADMEINYKQHCFKAEQNEAEMRDRLQRLKKREDFERRLSYGDNIHQGRESKHLKHRDRDSPTYWSMFDPICSMLNRWH